LKEIGKLRLKLMNPFLLLCSLSFGICRHSPPFALRFWDGDDGSQVPSSGLGHLLRIDATSILRFDRSRREDSSMDSDTLKVCLYRLM
jgi:hypothetical protein